MSKMEEVTQWSVDRVCSWLGTVGFDTHQKIFTEQGITGEVLIQLNHESLADLGIHSVGMRLMFLKAVYELKLKFNSPIFPGDYIPPVELEELSEDMFEKYNIADFKLASALRERDTVIKHLVQEISKLSMDVNKLREELKLTKAATPPSPSNKRLSGIPKRRPAPIMTKLFSHSPSYSTSSPSSSRNNINIPPSPHSPTPTTTPSTSTSSASEYSNYSNYSTGSHTGSTDTYSQPDLPSTDAIRVYGDRLNNRENEAYKSFRINLDDPCHKVIPAALRKYKINDDWRNYSLFIYHGNTERKLGLDDKPLSLYQQLKEANASPVFVLKHNKKGRVLGNGQFSNAPRTASSLSTSNSRSSVEDSSIDGHSDRLPDLPSQS